MSVIVAQAARRTALVLFPHQLFEEVLVRPRADRVYLFEHPLYFTQFPFHKQKLVLHRSSMCAFAERLTERGVAVRLLPVEHIMVSAGLNPDGTPTPPLQCEQNDRPSGALPDAVDLARHRERSEAIPNNHGCPTDRTGLPRYACGDGGHSRKSLQAAMKSIAAVIRSDGCTEILLYDLDDDWLERDVRRAFRGMLIHMLPSPMFLTDVRTLRGWFAGRARPRMGDFYAFQRRRLGVLVDEHGKPIGGKWSYDAENRKPLPRGLRVPARPSFGNGDRVTAAIRWVEASFPGNYGAASQFSYPTTHEEARTSLRFFLEACLPQFGDYEDAMAMDEPMLFHSVLTPSLNIGLLTPQEVISEILAYSVEHPVPLNALEGFIRQVIGWREFVRGLYHVHGRRQRTLNRFGFAAPIPEPFWNGDTGLVPADVVIRRVLQTGYCHHIERLMVLGSLMLLCEFSPDAVYEWFMTLFIDAYDWVMVPNVYGMSQYADGGIMATKPYISGSAYLRRMGDWPPGPWERVWDGLYWRFVDRHRDVFLANPRTSLAPRSFDRMDGSVRRAHYEAAEGFLERLHA